MPRGIPDMTRFRMAFSRGFFYEDVRDTIMPTIRDSFLPVETLEDYINPNITSARIPGLNDEGSPAQIKSVRNDNGGMDNRTVTWKGSIPAKENIDRTITLEMLLDDGYLTWLTMYMQTNIFLSLDNEESYLPPIIAQFMDMNDDIIMEMAYTGIRISEIDDVDLQIQDNGITTRTFNVSMKYNDSTLTAYNNRRLRPRQGGIVL